MILSSVYSLSVFQAKHIFYLLFSTSILSFKENSCEANFNMSALERRIADVSFSRQDSLCFTETCTIIILKKR